MPKSEQNIMHTIMIAYGKLKSLRIFRNNVGMPWTGNKIINIYTPAVVKVFPGDVVIREARPFHAGLCKGSSDLIGIQSIIITPAMVGQKIGIFIACETKTNTGKPTSEQERFIEMVNAMGGKGFIARSEEEALKQINQP